MCPPHAVTSLLSLSLPLFVGCMWLAKDGTPDAAQKEVSTLVHASLTALAKRSPADFRAAVAAFSAETRSRMETALREAAAASQAGTALSSNQTEQAAKPKIALRMDFSSFGKK
eukprot:6192190-Pleurochrysis_carterae.AAC.6